MTRGLADRARWGECTGMSARRSLLARNGSSIGFIPGSIASTSMSQVEPLLAVLTITTSGAWSGR
jgi:hypothetical protein